MYVKSDPRVGYRAPEGFDPAHALGRGRSPYSYPERARFDLRQYGAMLAA